MNPIQNLLSHQPVIVIDGALGTELERKGCDLNDALWSSKVLIDSPSIIKDIHLSYLEAGADCITTSSYQSSIEGFMAHGFDAQTAYALIRKSSEIAVEARDAFWSQLTEGERSHRQKPIVIASLGPYGAYLANGSEFRGDYPLDKQTMFNFYRPRIQALIEGGAEMLGCETLPSSEEALLVIELLNTEFPHVHAWFSFSAKDREHISNGETIESVVQAVASHDAVVAIGINCTAPQYIDTLIQRMATQTNKPIIVYPNSGETYDAEHKTWHDHSTHGEFATQAQTWFEHGARLIGGCCRTSPREIKDVAMRLKPQLS